MKFVTHPIPYWQDASLGIERPLPARNSSDSKGQGYVMKQQDINLEF